MQAETCLQIGCVHASVIAFRPWLNVFTTQLGKVKPDVNHPTASPGKVSLRLPPPDRTDGWGPSKRPSDAAPFAAANAAAMARALSPTAADLRSAFQISSTLACATRSRFVS